MESYFLLSKSDENSVDMVPVDMLVVLLKQTQKDGQSSKKHNLVASLSIASIAITSLIGFLSFQHVIRMQMKKSFMIPGNKTNYLN